MSDPAVQTQEKLQQDSLATIANVSRLLRNAIGDAFPVAPEQYLTVAIPGTVVDLTDVDRGGSYVWDVTKHAFPPLAVRQAEAALVDGMMPLAKVMLGNTGKSVARSYSRALDGIIPRKATIGVDDQLRSPGVPAYDAAMLWLTTRDKTTGKTPVDIYTEKQQAWGESQAEWSGAKIQAQRMAEALYPPTTDVDESGQDYIGKQTQYYNEWNQQNYQRYRTSVQAKWIDWVTNGQKYNVEYYFGMVDVDSIMARVEASKESMRNSSIVDADGANELYGVTLNPKQWATYCKRKAEGWWQINGQYTLGQLNAEIARLESLQSTYTQLQTYVNEDVETRAYPAKNPTAPTPTLADAKATVDAAIKTLYEKQGVKNAARFSAEPVKPEVETAIQEAEVALQSAQKAYDEASNKWNEYKMAALQDEVKDSVSSWATGSLTTIAKQIAGLKKLRSEKITKDPVNLPVIQTYTKPDEQDKNVGDGVVVAPPGSEYADPLFALDKNGIPLPPPPAGGVQNADDADPWTTISFSYSATDQKQTEDQSSWGMSVGGSVGWGLWSVGGSYSHDESHANMQNDMANCEVSISFSALVVNVNRPWLYGEIFNDFDLDVAAKVTLSPGPAALQQIIQDQNVSLMAKYGEFPSYPTSFVVAADTTIEFKGATSHIESHFNSHSNSGSLSVGYGPWQVSSSFHEAGSNKSVQMHSTATGCKLTFGAPQVIGWVSQILPALPRPENFNPLTQGAGVPLPLPFRSAIGS